MNANHIRQDTLKILAKHGGNTASNLASTEILTSIYDSIKHIPGKPNWQERDRVFVSETLTPALHATLAHAGYYAKKYTLIRPLPEGAPLGKGLSAALGNATTTGKNTYCLITDAELQHGNTWEALMHAGAHKTKITLLINRDNLQSDGYTNDVLSIEPLRAKLEAFNWNVIEVDGHNEQHIKEAIEEAKENSKPTAIIAHTIPGKGITFMENNHEWHSKKPNQEELETALAELRK